MFRMCKALHFGQTTEQIKARAGLLWKVTEQWTSWQKWAITTMSNGNTTPRLDPRALHEQRVPAHHHHARVSLHGEFKACGRVHTTSRVCPTRGAPPAATTQPHPT
jgi:ABC-type nickel/cobalt efflux system permease component RcnA